MFVILGECDVCGDQVERTFTDSWTGTELCVSCLNEISKELTMSPASDGDNLRTLLNEHGMVS